MLERHDPPQPDACDLCRYALDHGTEAGDEHALARLAFLILEEALSQEPARRARLSGIALRRFPPVDRRPIHTLEPRHYFWALFFSPTFQIVLREDVTE